MQFDVRTALIPIDMQRGFDLPPYPALNNPGIDANGLRLLAHWRAHGWPIVHVRHDSIHAASNLRPGHPGNALRDGFEPLAGEPLVSKSVNCAFVGTDLELRLRRMKVDKVVMFGLYADMCVSTSVRIASNLGFETYVVADACASVDQQGIDGVMIPGDTIFHAHLATLNTEFATVVATDALLAAEPIVATS
ncbi:MAG TPA: cysteine hydrolase family protein [Xanthomonadaceae bacterium]|nr:cysteine hydrolase family protein [Xanthomonadaceae bacterium]